MKKLFLLLPVYIVLFIMSGCKKERNYTSDNTATFFAINGIINNQSALVKMNGSINNSGFNSSGGNQNILYYQDNMFYFNEAKNTDITVLNRSDSSVLVTKNIDFKKGGIYTMLLAGAAPNAEAVVIDDSNIPKIDPGKMPENADSIMYVRFINLCPDAQPLNIRLQGSVTNEVTALPYKGYSPFIAYSNRVGTATRLFEFVENGNTIITRSFGATPARRFKNLALVLFGKKIPGPGQPGLAVLDANYYQ